MADFDDAPRTAADIVAALPSKFDGAMITSIVAIVETIDGETGQHNLHTIRDHQGTPIWRHLGMAELVAAELRRCIG